MAKAPVSAAGKPPAGKKIAGVPRKTAVIAGVALLAGVAFIIWRNHQAASSASQDTGTGADTSALGDTSGIQGAGMQGATGTETLVIKIREMQGHKRKPRPPAPKPKGRGSGGPPRRKTTGPPTVGRGRGRRTGAK